VIWALTYSYFEQVQRCRDRVVDIEFRTNLREQQHDADEILWIITHSNAHSESQLLFMELCLSIYSIKIHVHNINHQKIFESVCKVK